MTTKRCKGWTCAEETRLRVMWETRLANESPPDFDIRAARGFGRSAGSVKSKRNKLTLVEPSTASLSGPLLCRSVYLTRQAAELSNTAFLAALANVKRTPEPPVKPEQRFTMLPPPSLTGRAFS